MRKLNESFNKIKGLEITHPEKILYPEVGVTKLDLANYYWQIQEWILPYIIKRPLTLVRCPNGVSASCFFQKHLNENDNEFIFPVEIEEQDGIGIYSYIKNVKGLLSLVQMSALEIHIWGSHVATVEKPDMIVFDLDPGPEVSWKQVIKTANILREHLESIHLQSFVKTTGGKGLHVVVPIKPSKNWEEIKNFSHAVVHSMVEMYPNDYVDTATKAKRSGKIFIDYLRNSRGATAVAPYSTRNKENASVSMPLAWEDLTVKILPDHFTVANTIPYLRKRKKDPWEAFLQVKQSIKF